MRYDLIVRGGTLVRPAGTASAGAADVAVTGGVIAAIEPQVSDHGVEEIDAVGLHVFPGLVDTHVHFDEPGRTDWEGIATGSRALAAGGGTTFCDMPLNNLPPTLDAASFAAKRRAAEASSCVDFGLWGGLVPHNVAELPELAACGAVGVKAFMSASGVPEFERAGDETLLRGMEAAAHIGLLVAVHAESESLTRRLTAEIRAAGGAGVRDYLRSRPVRAELEAIERAIEIARQTGARLHVVHVSSGRGATLVAEARASGVDVTCETCPHYLVFTDEDVERLGAVAKCAPPVRDAAEREALWRALQAGAVDMVVSDHSPAAPELKRRDDFFAVWGGISGVQSTLSALLSTAHHARGVALDLVSRWVAAAPARRFGLAGQKGRLAPGADADLALVDAGAAYRLAAGDLLYRHRQSPYVGMRLRGIVRRTLLRGKTVYLDGRAAPEPMGRLVTPDRGHFGHARGTAPLPMEVR